MNEGVASDVPFLTHQNLLHITSDNYLNHCEYLRFGMRKRLSISYISSNEKAPWLWHIFPGEIKCFN